MKIFKRARKYLAVLMFPIIPPGMHAPVVLKAPFGAGVTAFQGGIWGLPSFARNNRGERLWRDGGSSVLRDKPEDTMYHFISVLPKSVVVSIDHVVVEDERSRDSLLLANTQSSEEE